MEHAEGPTRWWRPALCAATIFWLAGHWFFPEGHTHLKVFWCFLVPLLLLNIDAFPAWREINPWFRVLGVLLLWQVAVSARYSCHPLAIGGILDALTMILLLLAVGVLARMPGGWSVLRWYLFLVTFLTMGWSLVAFYPLRGIPLCDERFCNVLVYPEYLNAVLTGLLSGFGMLCGMTLDAPDRRRMLRLLIWLGIAALAFAMMATQSRGSILATCAGTFVLLWRRKLDARAAIIAGAAGVLAYLAVFWLSGAEAAPDLVSRGSSGRTAIWNIYLDRLDGIDWLLGEGFAAPLEKPVLNWYVHHPHSSFLTQLVHTGIPGLLLLVVFCCGALWSAWRSREHGVAALSLLAFGLTGLLMDGAQIASMFSVPRIENLLVLVPAVFALSQRQGRLSQPSGGKDPDPAPRPS